MRLTIELDDRTAASLKRAHKHSTKTLEKLVVELLGLALRARRRSQPDTGFEWIAEQMGAKPRPGSRPARSKQMAAAPKRRRSSSGLD